MPGPVVRREEVLEFLEARDRQHHPVVTTGVIAEEFDVTSRTINNRLRELHEDAEVVRHELGNTVVWWLPDERMESEESVASGVAASTGPVQDPAPDGSATGPLTDELIESREHIIRKLEELEETVAEAESGSLSNNTTQESAEETSQYQQRAGQWAFLNIIFGALMGVGVVLQLSGVSVPTLMLGAFVIGVVCCSVFAGLNLLRAYIEHKDVLETVREAATEKGKKVPNGDAEPPADEVMA